MDQDRIDEEKATPPQAYNGTKSKSKVTTKEVAKDGQSDTSSEIIVFPWQERDATRPKWKRASFPWKGAIGLAGSVLTVIASWALLFSIADTQQWDQKRTKGWQMAARAVKPAAILSAIISANSIFLHMAITEGLSIAWWWRASRQQATIAELHDTWSRGTNLLHAIKPGKGFNYVAIATILVACIPLNGVFLQGAITLQNCDMKTDNGTVQVTSLTDLPRGFSGSLSTNGSLQAEGYTMGLEQYYLLDSTDTSPYVVLNGPKDSALQDDWTLDENTGCFDTCVIQMPGVGFLTECDRDSPEYDMSASDTLAIGANGAVTPSTTLQNNTVFSLDFSWNVQTPNVIGMQLITKTEDTCAGAYTRYTCRMTVYEVKYDATINGNVTDPSTKLNQSSIIFLSDLYDNATDALVRPVDVDDESASTRNGTTWGHFSSAFQSFFGGFVSLSWDGQVYNSEFKGPFAVVPTLYLDTDLNIQLYDDYPPENLHFNEAGRDGCQLYIDSEEDILGTVQSRIRQFMFQFSARTWYDMGYYYDIPEFDVSSFNRTLDSANSERQNIYVISWWHWGVSVAISAALVLVVTPLYWGFWILARQPTMSPFETARAFYSPHFTDVPAAMTTPQVLEQYGTRRLHT